MNQPLVSIVSLVYDTKKEYVEQCINSILNQTYQNIEIIIMDDCSPNSNYDYLKELSPKIKLFRNEKNLGFNRNTQKSFDLAQGKYIVKIDSDDYIDPTLIEKEVKILETDTKYGAVCCELQRFGKQHSRIGRPVIWDLKKALYEDKGKQCGYEGGMMFRADLLSKISIDPHFRVCTDFDFNMQILEHSKIKSIHEPLYHYRSHDSNIMISARGGERIRIMQAIIKKHKKIYLSKCKKPSPPLRTKKPRFGSKR